MLCMIPAYKNLPKMLSVIREEAKKWSAPIAGTFAVGENAAFKVLISTVLSLRTKDTTTGPASERLFKYADTPQGMKLFSIAQIEKAIFPVGFYHTKAKNILKICDILIEKYLGTVPDDLDELLKLPGVGRKTANLVVTVAYKQYGICVDTHVHRISNRWALLRTKTPEETEMALRNNLPKEFWIEFNELLVSYGQNLCVPISPFCSRCKIEKLCPKVGVKKSR